MTEPKYKRLSQVFIITLAIFFISFFAVAYLMLQEDFQPGLLFACAAILAALSYLAFMRTLLWTLFNAEGKPYWRAFFEKRGLLDKPMFKGKEPADILKVWLLIVAVLAVAIIVLMFI